MTKQALVLLGIMVAGCAGGTSSTSSAGELSVQESEGQVTGYFIDHSEADLGRIDFTSRFVAEHQIETVLRFHGMAITQLADLDAGVVEFDGFAETGGSTQMTLEDHALLTAFTHALDATPSLSEPAARARNFASWWSEFPAGMEMQWQGQAPETRGANSLCGSINSYRWTTHDGWFESYGGDSQTLDGAYISWDGPCRAGDNGVDAQTSWWYVNGAWSCPTSEPNHSSSIEYEFGECTGQCGSGCGGRYQVYSTNCAEHDVCNRFGHSWSASIPGGHCADEFAAAGSDTIFEPNCDRGW